MNNSLQASSIAELASTAATDVGMHGLLASQSCCYPLVCVHCWPVVDLNRHPYILLISLEIFSFTCVYVPRFLAICAFYAF